MATDTYDEYDDHDYDRCEDWDCNEDEYLCDGVGFADPSSGSALRRETPSNPRIYPCPTCHMLNALTRIDKKRSYQCDRCADALERGWDRGLVCGGSEGGCEICKSYDDDKENSQ